MVITYKTAIRCQINTYKVSQYHILMPIANTYHMYMDSILMHTKEFLSWMRLIDNLYFFLFGDGIKD